MNMNNDAELFGEIPMTKSPHLLWIEKHNVKTLCTESCDEPWAAWVGDLKTAIDERRAVTAMTEDEALVKLARKNGWPMWNEEGFKA